MNEFSRRARRLVNPVSTGLTRWWLGRGRRQVPSSRPHTGSRPTAAQPGDHVRRPVASGGVASPGGWVAPPGTRPGWNWLPPDGAVPLLRSMPWWVRVWYRAPLIDRYAYEWMWWHGGWGILVTGSRDDGPPPAGVPARV